ncbi:MAG: peptidylprolyl isomerase [Flavobacterium sp. BFFFF2]|nr:MAG: peptidylprolyl isomerase [Flavobacterium sp. BFFFF2]
MAVLSKIRQRSGLLLIAIGVALLAFVVQDLFTKGFKSLSKDVGSVNGKDISYEEFQVKVGNAQKSRQGMSSAQAVNSVWDQMVQETLLSEQIDELGIRTTDAHFAENLKSDPNVGNNPMFQNAKGKLDLQKFKDYFNTIPDGMSIYNRVVKEYAFFGKNNIYTSLIKGGLYTTDLEGKFKYEAETNKVSFDFVSVPYTSIKDADVKISDEEITSYMKKHEKRFKSEEAREVDYVLIEDKPSADDEAEIQKNIEGLLVPHVVYNKETSTNDTVPGFKSTSDVAEFVNANSEKPYDTLYVPKTQLPAEFADALYNLPTGEVFGPYKNAGYFCLSRAMGHKAGAQAKASHILIGWEGLAGPPKKEKRTKEQAKAKAEDLLKQAQANPGLFAILAMSNSDDSSAQQGGDLGFFAPGQMVKPFNDFVFNNSVGKIGLVESQFGYHVINVTDKQDGVRLATISLKIEPSEATNDKIYSQATQFEMDAANKDFEKLTKTMKLNVTPAIKVRAMDEYFGSVGSQRQIVRWAFDKDTEVGSVKRFEIVNVGQVIAKLKKVYPKGLTPIDDAKVSVEPILRNEKKAQMLMAKMKGSSLASIASANKVTVQQALDVTIENANVPGAGSEPKVVASAFITKTGALSKPIEGNAAVYVLQNKSMVKAPVIAKHKDFVAKIKPTVTNFSYRVFQALKEDADIKDKRSEFNY